MKRTLLFSLIPSLLVSFSPAGRAEPAPAVPKVIHVAEIGGQNGKPLGAGVLTLAKEKGFFDEEFAKDGVTFDFKYYAGTGPAINEALAQGNADIGTYGGVPNVIGLAGGIPAHVVLTRHSRGSMNYYLAVRPDSGIKSVEDLRGKRISVQKGTNPYATLIRFLDRHGVAEKEVKIVNIQSADALAAFNAGVVDAITGTTNLLVLRDQGKVRLIADERDSDGGFADETNISGYLVNDAFAQKYPDVVERLVKVIVKASWWASQEGNREELITFLSRASVGGEKYVRDLYAGPLTPRFSPLIDGESLDGYRKIVAFGIEHKLVRPDAQFSEAWFEPKYLAQALKDLHLEAYWTPVGPPSLTSTP